MESFMDKLAQKFNSQDVIKANAQAEAEEFARTKEKLESYETCLDKLYALNDQSSQTLSQMNQTTGALEASEQNLKVQIAETLQTVGQSGEELKEQLGEVVRSIEVSQQQLRSQIQVLSNIENPSEKVEQVVAESIAKIRELESSAVDTKALEAKVDEVITAFEEKRTESVEKYAKLEEYMHKESVKVYRNVQASFKEESQKQMEEFEKIVKKEITLLKRVNTTAIATLAILLFVLILQILMSLNLL